MRDLLVNLPEPQLPHPENNTQIFVVIILEVKDLWENGDIQTDRSFRYKIGNKYLLGLKMIKQ